MPAPSIIKELVERFKFNIDDYKKGNYNETQVRREFIDPFFHALGWDVANENGYAEAYKDVIHEFSLKTKDKAEAPDYLFRIGGTKKFFVEAKKPSVNLHDDISPAFQLRRYAWSAKLPLSILTDFEELAVYDCRIQPKKNDKSSTGRISYFTYDQYIEKWDEIESIFSREAILKGSFDKFAESNKGKRGTAEVDDAFLKEIEKWRELLARNIALRNESLTNRELNFAVQKTIDRIIFLRICEDRGIEDYGQLMNLQNGANVYQRMLQIFTRADEKYNSGLFHFEDEKSRNEDPDKITPTLAIDDDKLKEIIKNLYYPDSPYEFSVLPSDILGHVYEQFLGKVIRLTKGHQAKIEEKPEVKKAGGVYYTPTYIVDYIVKNTLGKKLEEIEEKIKENDQASIKKAIKEASKIKVLDPACGSGSFLIGAYQYLLDWHIKFYTTGLPPLTKGRAGVGSPIYQTKENDYRLTTAEKKRILLNNIYGVDIDSQAVEVTKLSLLLKVLEGETDESLNTQLSMFRERALPDLSNNIKCGNSLIGPDFYNQTELTLDEEENYRINVFDWNDEFKEIMNDGGFDVVVGNPPWGSLITPEEKIYLSNNFVNKRGEAESHLYFIESGFKKLNQKGSIGLITPDTWLVVNNSKEIRKYLLEVASFKQIVHLSKYIFKDAPDIVPVLVFLDKEYEKSNYTFVKSSIETKIDAGNFESSFLEKNIRQDTWLNLPNHMINLNATEDNLNILKKCDSKGVTLKSIFNVNYGIKTGNNERFLKKEYSNTHNKRALKTGELKRFSINWKGFYLWWTKELAGYRNSPIEVPKIIIQYIRKISLKRRIIAALDSNAEYYPLNNYSYIYSENKGEGLECLLAILNSKLINFYFANTFIDYNIKPTYLKEIPIAHKEGFNIPLSTKVKQIINLNSAIENSKTPQERKNIERQIAAVDKQIDQLVYELYGLTEDEIKIVEDSIK